MKAQLRQKAVDLRLSQELSYGEIVKQLGVAKSTLSYWLKDFPLTEEKILELRRKNWQASETSREKFRLTMKKRKEEKALEIYEQQKRNFKNLSPRVLWVAGLMLYLGEGDKKNSARIGLANTDVWIIQFFLRWLVKFMGVRKDEIKMELHLYENMDIAKEEKFWQDKLGLPRSQFYKTQIRKLRAGSFSYSESFRHGTCSLLVSGTERKTKLMMSMKAFLDSCWEN